MLDFCVEDAPDNKLDQKTCLNLKKQGINKISIICDIFMDKDVADEDVIKISVILEESGLSAETSHPPFGSYNEPFSIISQKAQRKEEIEWMQKFIVRCGMLHIKAIPLHTSGAMLPNSQDWEIELAHEYVTCLLPFAEKSGVKIAIENTNHARPIDWYKGVQEEIMLDKNIWEYDSTEKIIDFVESFGTETVGICYDTGHSHLQGKVIEDMHAFKDKIILFHLHDNDGAYNDSHIQPGYGNTPWFELFDIIEGQRYKDVPYFIEASPKFGDLDDMLYELKAVLEKRVVVGPGGFLKKDKDSGKIIVL